MYYDWKNKLSIFILVSLAFLDGFLVATEWKESSTDVTALEPVILLNILEQKSSSEVEEEPFSTPPFTSQAPYGIWDTPWAYFAEEACALMASTWVNQEEITDSATALLEIRDWENGSLGTFKDTDLSQTLRILKEFYFLQAEISYDVSREALLAALDEGKILLVPIDGQVLDNPHYAEPGPEHHMILIYAYEGENFFANDPGTGKGEATLYSIEKILEAVQDLNGEDRVIVVSP